MTNEQLVDLLARAIAIHSYHDNGLETMSYAGEADFADRESHHYVGEAKSCIDALAPMMSEVVGALKLAEYELIAIRARDGAPQHIDWSGGRPLQTSSCTHEWWNEVTEKCSKALASLPAEWRGGE